MKTYEGRCRGGPLDGKDLAHTSSVYRVVIPVWNGKPFWSEAPFDAEHGEYRHVANQWIWQTRSPEK